MPIIDIHSHVFSADKPLPKAYLNDPHWDLADRLLGPGNRARAERGEHPGIHDYMDRMDGWGVDRVCINNIALSKEGARAINDFNAGLVADHPGRLIGFAAVPMAADQDGASELSYAVEELGFRGAKIYPWLHGVPLDAPEMLPIYEAAAELDVPLLTHTMAFPRAYSGSGGVDWLDYTHDNPARLFDSGILFAIPNLKIIFAHLAGGFVFYRDMLLAKDPEYEAFFERIYVDLAPPVAYSARDVQVAIDAVGPDHVLFGLDVPFIDFDTCARCVPHIRTMGLPSNTERGILGENAAQLLGL